MADTILRVNMSDLSTKVEAVPEEWAGPWRPRPDLHYCRCRSQANLPSTGPTQQTRHCAGSALRNPGSQLRPSFLRSKSPLTGTIKEANSGGTSAQMLARLGVKALIIEGKPADANTWYSLHVSAGTITVQEETEVIGLGNFAVVEALNKRLGDKIGVITIGPAGEMRMTGANISIKDPDNHIRSSGRGGLGAVMGSKQIKFISVEPTSEKVPIADPEAFKAANRAFAKALVDNPISKALGQYGTNVLVNIINESGGLPTRNFTSGQFAGHEAISGETMHDTIVARGGKPKHNCHAGCVINCSQIYTDQGSVQDLGF
jgi:aldehyde:ferredoxin oxidoreductase